MYSDEQYIEAVHSGDADLFDLFVRQHIDSLLRFAHSITGSSDSAHDVVQDVFISIWTRGNEWAPRSALTPYLFSAVRNRALNLIKADRNKQRFEARVLADSDIEDNRLNPVADDVFVSERVKSALDALTIRQREAVHLRYFEGLTLQEVSQILNIDMRATKRLLARSLSTLSDPLSDLKD